MPDYQSITSIATALQTDEKTLADFRRKGWIAAVERHDTVFLATDQRCRAKYILYLLEARHLSDDQVQLVLTAQRPPYASKDVDEILKRSALPMPAAGAAGA